MKARYLKDALDAVVAGKPPAVPETKGLGCGIKFRSQPATMSKGRLEAFSDGVIAIIITIMVLEMKVPHGGVTWRRCGRSRPVFVSYVLSYVFIGIYWVNHHHLMHAGANG